VTVDSGRQGVQSRSRLTLAVAAAVLLIAVIVAASSGGGGGQQRLSLPGSRLETWAGDPFTYMPARAAQFVARATSGSANVLFIKSPGGVIATAARVASYRPLINAAVAGTGIDPALLEGLVFLESAGYPNALAGSDAADAAGLGQILAQTGQSLLGMHIDLAASRHLTALIDAAYAGGHLGLVARLQRRRARIDDRFDPRRALAGTVRYLQIAGRRFGRIDLAIVSYHMGIGNLSTVLADYNGGHPVPYVQLYFDTAPDHHPGAYNLLSGFGDDSSLYYWRVLGAVQIMQLYRTDRAALTRLVGLETAGGGSDAAVLRAAETRGMLVALPTAPGKLGLAYARGVVAGAGLAPAALDLLAELGVRVRRLWAGTAPLVVTRTGSGGYSFSIARRYASRAQADAFQAMLDRLQALNLIAWTRTPATIDVTVASDASRFLVHGP
jgi:soluble lytic murein transglycosylase-like protein